MIRLPLLERLIRSTLLVGCKMAWWNRGLRWQTLVNGHHRGIVGIVHVSFGLNRADAKLLDFFLEFCEFMSCCFERRILQNAITQRQLG